MDATTNPEFDKWWQDWLSAITQRHAQLEGVSGASHIGSARPLTYATGFSCAGGRKSPLLDVLEDDDS